MSSVTPPVQSIQEPMCVHTRWMIRSDLPQVVLIEAGCFSGINQWSEENFRFYLSQRNCIGMVVEVGEKIMGFFVYELHVDHFRILNLAVSPDPEYRHRKIGSQMIDKLKQKLRDERTKIIAIMPEPHKDTAVFFEKNEVEIRLTKKKGVATFEPVFSTMMRKDTEEVQEIENNFMCDYRRKPRNIDLMMENSAAYGIVARDKVDNRLLGYLLYNRETSGIYLNGEFGIIVKNRYRKQGIGRKLMMELTKQNLPITVSDIYLNCKDQVGFLRAMGVDIPQPPKYITVKWEPKLPA